MTRLPPDDDVTGLVMCNPSPLPIAHNSPWRDRSAISFNPSRMRPSMISLSAIRHKAQKAMTKPHPTLHVRRVKSGTPVTHPFTGRKMRELRRHQREGAQSPFAFVSDRGAPLTAPEISRMVERAAVAADLGIKAHAHILRHACGYKLAK